jgi:hypothetical protein
MNAGELKKRLKNVPDKTELYLWRWQTGIGSVYRSLEPILQTPQDTRKKLVLFTAHAPWYTGEQLGIEKPAKKKAKGKK